MSDDEACGECVDCCDDDGDVELPGVGWVCYPCLFDGYRSLIQEAKPKPEPGPPPGFAVVIQNQWPSTWDGGSIFGDKAAKPEAVDHPRHYRSHPSGVECITVVEHMTFNVGNAIKYVWRHDRKNGLEDLRKAAWYVAREIERRAKINRSFFRRLVQALRWTPPNEEASLVVGQWLVWEPLGPRRDAVLALWCSSYTAQVEDLRKAAQAIADEITRREKGGESC